MIKSGAIFLTFLLAFPVVLPGHVRAENPLVITQIQLGGAGTGTASQEFIELYNPRDVSVDITDWCVHYASASTATNGTALYCFSTAHYSQRLLVAPGGSVKLATTEFLTAQPGMVVDARFSADLSGTGGHVKVLNSDKQVIDSVGWGSAAFSYGQAAAAPSPGEALQRRFENNAYVMTQNNRADFTTGAMIEPAATGLYEAVDVCLNNDAFPGFQSLIPDGFVADESGYCTAPTPAPVCEGVILSEVLPNPGGVDTGVEYIELQNTSSSLVDLSACSIDIDGNVYALSGELTAGAFITLRDYVLPNSAGGTITLLTSFAEEAVVYPASMKDDESYALIAGRWQRTLSPTPGAGNRLGDASPSNSTGDASGASGASGLAPCGPGKFRNPATNRCKQIAAASTALQACAADQFRNPETNRCKKIAAVSASLQPCAPGQERNPSTNRCRKISSDSTSLKPCAEGQERNPETNRCRKIAGVAGAASAVNSDTALKVSQNYRVIGAALATAAGYGVYEYRQDIGSRLQSLRRRFGKSK